MSPANRLGTRRSRKKQLSKSSRRSKFMELPVEVVRIILRLVYPISEPKDLDSNGFDPEPPHMMKIIGLSSVCSLWRDIVLKDPTLWSVVKLPSKPALIRMSTLRSGQSPLIVDIRRTEDQPRPTKTMVDLVFGEYHRFKMLGIELGVFTNKIWESVQSVMTHSAPILEALYLQTPETGYDAELDGIMKGGAPRLKELYIRGEWIPTLPLTSLRVLDLSVVLIFVDDTESYENLYNLLMANPQLESLSLDLTSPSIPSETRTIHLPNLKDFCLRADQSHLSDILRGLVLPFDTHCLFEISECDSTATGDTFDAILSQTPLVSLKIVISQDRFHIWVAQLNSRVSSVFHYDLHTSSRPPFVLRNTILPKLDLSNVTAFSLTINSQSQPLFTEDEKDSIENVFQVLTSLRELTVSYWSYVNGQYEGSYLDSLIHPVGPDESSLPCPFLEELEIIGLEVPPIPYANQLKQCILVRSEANCPFSEVRMVDCKEISSKVHALLDGLVEWEDEDEDEDEDATNE